MIPRGAFPLLTADNRRITSPPSRRYNCVAWAAGDVDRWWWPDEQEVGFWPDGIPREQTVDAFVRAYRTLGFERCDDAELEVGFEKIALYAMDERPTHVARQLPSGRWSSKLGAQEDIEHERDALDGPVYGSVVAVLRRPLGK